MMEDTKQNIVDAAIFTFNEDLSAPLEKVAEKAGVTRRTLHRYFKDRKELLICCNQEMYKSCSRSMTVAQGISDDPLEQLRNFLYAAIDCGVKYAFLHKLHNLHGHQHLHDDKDCVRYDQTFDQIRKIIETLQKEDIVNKRLTVEWITKLFPATVTATIDSLDSGNTDSSKIKEFAWYSFSKGIGV